VDPDAKAEDLGVVPWAEVPHVGGVDLDEDFGDQLEDPTEKGGLLEAEPAKELRRKLDHDAGPYRW
jgi:hypothetical protein